MKKYLAMLLVFAMLLGLAACSSSDSLAEPGEDVYRKDVQEYITEVLNSDGQISSFQKISSEQKDGTLQVICDAFFGESRGEFTLSYTNDGNAWTLDKCRVQLKDPDDPTSPTQGSDVTDPTNPPVQLEGRGYLLYLVGTIKDPDRGIQVGDEVLAKFDGQEYDLCDYLGNPKTELHVQGGEYMGSGVYAIQEVSDSVNSVGLIAQNGTQLIPFEAYSIAWPESLNSETDRYLIVTYTTGETTNADDCFTYETDSMISWGPEEGDTMYTGYARVYDLVNKCFVENVKITNGDRYAVQPCGDNFFVTDKAGVSTLYNAKGENLFQTSARLEVGNGAFIVSDGGTYRVYDPSGNQTYTSNKGIWLVDGNGGYIYRLNDGKNVVMDRTGKQVIGDAVDSVLSERNDVFVVKSGDKYALVHADGTAITAPDRYTSLYHTDFGIYCAEYDGKYALLDTDGVIGEDLPTSGLVNFTVESEGKMLVINTGEFSVELEDSYIRLVKGMIAAGSEDTGLYGVIDLFTGTQLLPYEYEVVDTAAGYLYAYKNGEWSVYQIIGPEA